MAGDELLAEAIALGDRLVETAIWHEGRANWLCHRREMGPHGGALAQALDPGIHVGTAGVGLFLARLARYSGDHRHAETARAAVRQSLRHGRYTEEYPPYQANGTVRTGQNWRYGFYLGSLGIAWTAIEVAGLLDEPSFESEGRRLASDVMRSRSSTFEVDLSYGAASGISTLLDLERRGWQQAGAWAQRLGDLVVGSAFVRGDTWSWGQESHNGRAKNLTGLSHGAAGVGLALAELHAATGEARFAEAARGAFRYEKAMYDEELENWPYFLAPISQRDGRYPARSTWCHGAPGIGLSRALAHPVLKDAALLQDLKVAHRTSVRRLSEAVQRQDPLTTLCCGTCGVAECVWHMETAMEVPGALGRARDFMRYNLELYGGHETSRSDGWIDWATGAPKGTHPGLLQGIAGVGHLMLQLHDPARVPTVLVPARGMKA